MTATPFFAPPVPPESAGPPPPPRSRRRLWLVAALLALLVLAGVIVLIVRSLAATATSAPSTPAVLQGALPSWPVTGGQPTSCTPGGRLEVGRKLVIGSGEWICGRATAIGGSIEVFGRVGGDVVIVGGDATIAGQVDGNVSAVGGSVSLLEGARVGGTVKAYGGSVQREQNVIVVGGIQPVSTLSALAPLRLPFFLPGSGPVWPSMLFWALAGFIVARFFREPLLRVERVASVQVVPSLVVGALAIIAAVGCALLLAVTCLGIPLALLLLVAVWVSWVVGTVAVGSWLGGLLVRGAPPAARQMLVLPAMVGVVVLAGVEALPCIGIVVGIVVGCVALGSVVLTFMLDRRARRLAY